MSICRFPLVVGGALIAVGALSACESMPAIQTGKPVTDVQMKATMTAASEVPPKSSNGEGYAFITYNQGTRALTWKVYFTWPVVPDVSIVRLDPSPIWAKPSTFSEVNVNVVPAIINGNDPFMQWIPR